MRKNLFLSFFVTCWLLSAVCHAGAGTSGAQFLKIGIDAKTSALGGVGAVSSGPESLFLNPAGIYCGSARTAVNLSQAMWIESVNYSNVAISREFGFGALGLGVNYLSVPAITKYDSAGAKQEESYSPTDMAVTLGYGNKISAALSYGVNVKYISSKIDTETAAAFGGDLGAQYLFNDLRLKLGAVIQNIGTQLKYVNEGDPLPTTFTLGAKYTLPVNSKLDECFKIDHGVNFNLDVNYVNDSGAIGRFGIEYARNFGEFGCALRTGYKTNVAGLTGSAGLTAGLGLEYNDYSLDYAFVTYGVLTDVHRISLGMKW
ncbi:MAG: hypothetical protein CVU77_06520 [Elusimicrobia bacterium HGW-Elusimicrobia-1]|jgi:hypothetical protein|nr:MAG: hypothetical protein CVU77_06520 [Elusimicrobia bacterium HGW-Elusimicrobia-1]